jgi:hypothetical protein
VCDVADCDDVVLALDDALVLLLESLVVAAVSVLFELAAAVWVVLVAACPSCQASTPPSESIAATLTTVTALRARAARGLRLGRPARAVAVREWGTGCSSMTTTVRRSGEREARGR